MARRSLKGTIKGSTGIFKERVMIEERFPNAKPEGNLLFPKLLEWAEEDLSLGLDSDLYKYLCRITDSFDPDLVKLYIDQLKLNYPLLEHYLADENGATDILGDIFIILKNGRDPNIDYTPVKPWLENSDRHNIRMALEEYKSLKDSKRDEANALIIKTYDEYKDFKFDVRILLLLSKKPYENYLTELFDLYEYTEEPYSRNKGRESAPKMKIGRSLIGDIRCYMNGSASKKEEILKAIHEEAEGKNDSLFFAVIGKYAKTGVFLNDGGRDYPPAKAVIVEFPRNKMTVGNYDKQMKTAQFLWRKDRTDEIKR